MVKEEKLNSSAKNLIACEFLNSIIDLFIHTFLVAYLLNITNDNISSVAIYYIFDFLLLGSCIYLLGFLFKKHNIANIYRVGIIFKCVFVLAIVFLKQDIKNYLIPIAIIFGIAEATYWGSCDNLIAYVTNNKNRLNYITSRRVVMTLTRIIMPLVLGTSIELLSFSKVSTYVLIIAVIEVILCFFIKIKGKNSEPFCLGAFLKSLKNHKNISRLKTLYKSSILYGILLDIIPTMITILIVITFKTNFHLGLLNTILAICSMITLFIYRKFSNSKRIKTILILGGLISLASVISLILNIGKIELIIYNFISNSFIVILEVIFNTERFNHLDNGIEEKYIIENQVFLTMIMQIGRIVGYVILLIASLLNNIIYFKITLLLFTIFIPIYSVYMCKLQEK